MYATLIIKLPKHHPMTCKILFPTLLVFTSQLLFAHTVSNIDSATYFLQRGMDEKKTGRRMESLRNFEKAFKYDNTNKVIVNELASSYFDLRKYSQAKETYKKLVDLGDGSASTYKQLMTLSFNMRQQDDVLLYANKLKQADPNERVNFYIGKVHYDRENYGDAIKSLTEALKEDQLNGEAAYMIARSYADMQNYKQAIPFFPKSNHPGSCQSQLDLRACPHSLCHPRRQKRIEVDA